MQRNLGVNVSVAFYNADTHIRMACISHLLFTMVSVTRIVYNYLRLLLFDVQGHLCLDLNLCLGF